MEIKTENDEFKLPRKERTYTCDQCEQTFPRYSSNKIRKAKNEHLKSKHRLSKFEQSVILN